MKKLLYLMRHGQTEWNRKLIALGRKDMSLNQRGRQQAKETASYLKNINFSEIISSPLKRALETAEIVAKEAGLLDLLKSDKRLMEFDLGSWEGMSMSKLYQTESFIEYRKDPVNVPFPSGEGILDVQQRTVSLIEQLPWKDSQPILLVAHNGTIKLIISHYLKLPAKYFWKLQISNAALSLIDCSTKEAKITAINFLPSGNYQEEEEH